MVGLGIGLGMFPVLNWLARMGGAKDDGPGVGTLSSLVWCGIGVQLGLYMLTYMSYGSLSRFLSFNANFNFHSFIFIVLFSVYVHVHLILCPHTFPPRNDKRPRAAHRVQYASFRSHRGIFFVRAFSRAAYTGWVGRLVRWVFGVHRVFGHPGRSGVLESEVASGDMSEWHAERHFATFFYRSRTADLFFFLFLGRLFT